MSTQETKQPIKPAKRAKTKEKQAENDESGFDLTLRPQNWKDYIGQEKAKTNLKLIIEAAKQRKETCDHLLFHGQAGLGKTTLAYIVAHEMEANMRVTSGPALEKAGDIAAILSNLEPHEILFIDEVHRINKTIEEILYPAMESRKMHLIVGKGPSARTFSLDLPPFTVIAATTKANLLSNPLRSRFGAVVKLDYYLLEDIEKIINRSATLLKTTIESPAVKIIAQASRFTPRIANRLLKRVRDYAQVYNKGNISAEAVKKTFEMLEVDDYGLEEMDRRILKTIIERWGGGPVGVKALSSALNEEVGTIEDIYEPFLMMLGLIHRTAAGRIATKEAYHHLGYEQKTSLF